MCRHIKSPCHIPETNIVLYVNYTSKTTSRKKKDQICVYQRPGIWGRGIGCQKVQTFGYKIDKYQRCNVQPDKLN